MKSPINMIFQIFVLSIFLLSCHKDIHQVHTQEYFPNTVGDYWEYNVTDSSASTPNNPSPRDSFTVKVTITGIEKLLDGKNASVWQCQFPSGNLINYVRIDNDTVEIFDLSHSQSLEGLKYPDLVFLLPFEVNKRWDGKLLLVDTLRVINQADVKLPFQTFPGCFEIYHHYLGPNMEYNDNYWFKPYVGMVSIYTEHYSNGPIIYRNWQLKTYSLN